MSASGEGHDTRTVVVSLVVGVFFGGMVGGVAFPTLPRLGSILGFSALVVGVILAINRATRMIVNAPAGAILDRVGTRKPMLVGFLFEGLAAIGYLVGYHVGRAGPGALAGLPVAPSTASAASFLLARVIWGIGSAFVLVGAFSTVTKVTTPANRGKWTGYMRGGQSLGMPAGLVVGGLAADVLGFQAAFAIAGLAAAVALVVSFFILPDLTPDENATEGETRLRDVPRLAVADTRVFAVGATNFVVRFLYAGILLSTAVEYAAANDIHVGLLDATGVSGVVLAVAALFSAVATVLVGPLADRAPTRSHVVVPSIGLLGAGFALLALVPTLLGTFAGVALIGLGVEGANLPLMAYLGDISPEDDVGKLGGVYNVFGDFGATVGPLVALPLATAYGYTAEYLGCVLLCVLAIGVVALAITDDGTATVKAAPAND
ncbi:hypothetical protein MBEHAL_1716 [Halarchaeum acidiphilum MH1-52-1]|uniref:Major facilitator superfamily (MFS) profile domain-containing protein n=1 Tax=Halarchaeum acidiphilum MH1-52-1 TaxID=1261545 RepID=U2YFR8_9EURY|nr:hypothetical protein MBEHAL_1716 [Halarchaeum acidiphilum MH1-52-1]